MRASKVRPQPQLRARLVYIALRRRNALFYETEKSVGKLGISVSGRIYIGRRVPLNGLLLVSQCLRPNRCPTEVLFLVKLREAR